MRLLVGVQVPAAKSVLVGGSTLTFWLASAELYDPESERSSSSGSA